MKVLAHPDPFVLEAELLDRIAAAQRDDPLARVLVIVPTSRLAAHVERRVAERHGARLGVEVLVHRALAHRILETAPGPPLRVISPLLLEGLLERVLDQVPTSRLTDFAKERPGAVGSILETLEDLREAGIPPGALQAYARGEIEGAIAAVYDAYHAGLVRAETLGFVDEAGLVRRALPHAPGLARARAEILHHGAYELIGVHLDLTRTLDRARPVTFLVPAEPGAPATAHAEDFARRFLLDADDDLERLADRPGGLLGPRLAALYDESRSPEPLEEQRVVFRHAQGSLAELRSAARSALAAVSSATPPHEIAIVARDLEPYSAAIQEELEEAGAAYASSAGAPLRREPAVRDLLLLLRAAANDFPRPETAELLRSPVLRLEKIGAPAGVPGDLAEPWGRSAGLLGGLEGWTRDLADWAARPDLPEDASEERRRREEARSRERARLVARIGEAVAAVARRCDARTLRTWREHADRIEAIAREVCPQDPRSTAALQVFCEKVLEEARRIETVLGDGDRVPFADVVSWLERAAGRTEVPVRAQDDGGLRVLHAMQARGLTFARTLLIGMHAGLFPRTPREDPFLSDDARARLREATRRPIPVKREGAREERLLLALLLGSARERLEVSWQRADETGKARPPSLALREVSRVVLGDPDVEAAKRRAEPVASHPRHALEALAKHPGLLREEEGQILAALRASERGDDFSALAATWPELSQGLAMMAATESFAPRDLRWDGRVGPGIVHRENLSVSDLETLGACPLRFLLLEGLRLRPLDEDPDPFTLSPRRVGSAVHELLREVYATLAREGPFVEGRLPELRRRAVELLESSFDTKVGPTAADLARRAPLIWEGERARWLRALRAFVEEDLARLAALRAVRGLFERSIEKELDLGEGVTLRVRARLDRMLAAEGQALVGDYKTSGKLDKRADRSVMLKGQTLQVPVYAFLAGEGAQVELLGVGPDHDPAGGALPEERRVAFEGFGSAEPEAGFLETLRVLATLLEKGRFPLHKDRHCAWCEVAAACRRNHPPTVHREDVAPDVEDYRDTLLKNVNERPTLEKVRAWKRGQEGDE